MEIKKLKISDVKPNPKNPRIIKDDKFKKLVRSIQEFPQMLEIRPIVIDEEGYVLGGNMRLKASKEAGLTEVPTIRVEDLTEEQKLEFIIKDNANFGDWDWEVLQSNWDMSNVGEWGVDVFELPSDVDYSLLDGDGEDGDDIDSQVKDKAASATKSILLPFVKEDEYKEFMKILQGWVKLGLDPGHEVLKKIKA